VVAITVSAALAEAAAKTDRVDARVLLMHVLGVDRAALIAHPHRVLTGEEHDAYRALISARAHGKPIAQLIGTREFYGRVFHVNEHVLIPRPETELLVEQALARLSTHLAHPRALDLGTGSGAIAITLSLEKPTLDVTAVDVSKPALACARANAAALGAQEITLIESDWFSALGGARFDLIVANPPYIAGGDAHLAAGDLRFEPTIALTDQSADGLASIRHIVTHAPDYLEADGWLLIEHGYDQGPSVAALFKARGFTEVETVADLASHQRLACGRWHEAHAVKSIQP
jgi:release factor glutamine methyltransferase